MAGFSAFDQKFDHPRVWVEFSIRFPSPNFMLMFRSEGDRSWSRDSMARGNARHPAAVLPLPTGGILAARRSV